MKNLIHVFHFIRQQVSVVAEDQLLFCVIGNSQELGG